MYPENGAKKLKKCTRGTAGGTREKKEKRSRGN